MKVVILLVIIALLVVSCSPGVEVLSKEMRGEGANATYHLKIERHGWYKVTKATYDSCGIGDDADFEFQVLDGSGEWVISCGP